MIRPQPAEPVSPPAVLPARSAGLLSPQALTPLVLNGGNGGARVHPNGHVPPLSPAERRLIRRQFRIIRLGDIAIVVAALLGGFLAAYDGPTPAGLQGFLEIRLTVRNLMLVAGFAIAWRLVCLFVGLYDERLPAKRDAEALRVLLAVTASAAVGSIFPMISVTRAFSPIAILYYWITAVAGMFMLRAAVRAMLPAQSKTQDVIIVGSGPRAVRLYRELCEQRTAELRFLGFVDSSDAAFPPEVASQLLGNLDALEDILMRQAVDQVLIALPTRSRYAEIQRTIEICERGGVPAKYLGDVFQSRTSGESHSSASLTAVPGPISPDDPRLLVKRWLDVVLGCLALVVATPIIAVAAIAIKLSSPGPVIFVQERYGLNKRKFRMYKLRTMVVDAEAKQVSLESRNELTGPVFKIREDPRVTRLGRLLRRLSIDELPQLVNVVCGDMSLVGPRPLPLRDVSLFSEPALMRRFSVNPGITGLWQVSGRNELDFDEWIRLDLQYIDQWSLTLEIKILLRTLPTVLRRTGAA